MEDGAIIDLYCARNEDAIGESERKYGAFCRKIALNILQQREDAEECVNDTWHAAWNAMPPERPACLRAFLGRITRNLSISRWRRERAGKRCSGAEVLLSELGECIPSGSNPEAALDKRLLTEAIAQWLGTLSADDRALFLRRYWYGDSITDIAAAMRTRPHRVTVRLSRIRKRLSDYLKKEGLLV